MPVLVCLPWMFFWNRQLIIWHCAFKPRARVFSNNASDRRQVELCFFLHTSRGIWFGKWTAFTSKPYQTPEPWIKVFGLFIYIFFLYLEADQVQHIQIRRWQLITLSGVLLHGWLKSLSSKGTIYDLKLKHAGSKKEFSDWIFNLNSGYHILAVPIETMHHIP